MISIFPVLACIVFLPSFGYVEDHTWKDEFSGLTWHFELTAEATVPTSFPEVVELSKKVSAFLRAFIVSSEPELTLGNNTYRLPSATELATLASAQNSWKVGSRSIVRHYLKDHGIFWVPMCYAEGICFIKCYHLQSGLITTENVNDVQGVLLVKGSFTPDSSNEKENTSDSQKYEMASIAEYTDRKILVPHNEKRFPLSTFCPQTFHDFYLMKDQDIKRIPIEVLAKNDIRINDRSLNLFNINGFTKYYADLSQLDKIEVASKKEEIIQMLLSCHKKYQEELEALLSTRFLMTPLTLPQYISSDNYDVDKEQLHLDATQESPMDISWGIGGKPSAFSTIVGHSNTTYPPLDSLCTNLPIGQAKEIFEKNKMPSWQSLVWVYYRLFGMSVPSEIHFRVLSDTLTPILTVCLVNFKPVYKLESDGREYLKGYTFISRVIEGADTLEEGLPQPPECIIRRNVKAISLVNTKWGACYGNKPEEMLIMDDKKGHMELGAGGKLTGALGANTFEALHIQFSGRFNRNAIWTVGIIDRNAFIQLDGNHAYAILEDSLPSIDAGYEEVWRKKSGDVHN